MSPQEKYSEEDFLEKKPVSLWSLCCLHLQWEPTPATQQTRNNHQVLGWCWPIACDAGPTSTQHWAVVSCLLAQLEETVSVVEWGIATVTLFMWNNNTMHKPHINKGVAASRGYQRPLVHQIMEISPQSRQPQAAICKIGAYFSVPVIVSIISADVLVNN